MFVGERKTLISFVNIFKIRLLSHLLKAGCDIEVQFFSNLR